MPFAFQAVLLIGTTCYLLTAVLFLLTRGMPHLNPGASWWMASSLAGAAGYAALFILGTLGLLAEGEAAYNIALLLWALFLYMGTSEWLGQPVKRSRLVGSGLATTVWLVYFSLINPQFLPAALAVSLYCGGLNLSLVYKLVRFNGERNYLHGFLIAFLTISGLHWLDYPVLRPLESIGPIGFFVCAIISVSINSVLAAMVIICFKQRMLLSEQKAIKKATLDSLTGLKNRLALEMEFAEAMGSIRTAQTTMIVVFADLDKFKQINDNFGHDVGDQVLVTVAARIKSVIRTSDIAARLGGDEFVIILTEMDTHFSKQLPVFIARLIETISSPLSIQGNLHQVGISLGVAHYPSQGSSLADLINCADKAMYLDKMMKKRIEQKNYQIPSDEGHRVRKIVQAL